MRAIRFAGCAVVFMWYAWTGAIQAQSVPSSYNLMSVLSGTQAWVPEVQNQGDAEDCWTFASATAMNSNLLMQGLLPASLNPPAITISSWHLSTTNGAPDQLLASEAFNPNLSNWGGNEYQTLGYVTRGSGSWQIPNAPAGNYIQTMGGGPVVVTNNTNNDFPVSISNETPQSPTHPDGYPPNLSTLIPPAAQQINYRVNSMTFYDQGFSNNVALPTPSGTVNIDGTAYDTYSFTQGAADPQVAAVKSAIFNTGAVTTYMNANNQNKEFVATTTASGTTIDYFNGTTATAFSDHVVTIIGWNDAYTMTNPGTQVTSTGAWLVQNSWGTTNWLNGDGTFWASYNDAVIGRSGVTSYQLSDNSPYSQTVIQNELGPMDYSGNYNAVANAAPAGIGAPTGMASHHENTVASILNPESDGSLVALGLVTQVGGVLVDVDIYDSWNNGPSNLLSCESFLLEGIGYCQVDLTQAISLTASDSLVIQLTYLDPNTLLPIYDAVPVTIGGSGINGYTQVTQGLSFYLDGGNWTDFASIHYAAAYSGSPEIDGGILFLKGITAVPEPEVILLLAGAALIFIIRRKLPSLR